MDDTFKYMLGEILNKNRLDRQYKSIQAVYGIKRCKQMESSDLKTPSRSCDVDLVSVNIEDDPRKYRYA